MLRTPQNLLLLRRVLLALHHQQAQLPLQALGLQGLGAGDLGRLILGVWVLVCVIFGYWLCVVWVYGGVCVVFGSVGVGTRPAGLSCW